MKRYAVNRKQHHQSKSVYNCNPQRFYLTKFSRFQDRPDTIVTFLYIPHVRRNSLQNIQIQDIEFIDTKYICKNSKNQQKNGNPDFSITQSVTRVFQSQFELNIILEIFRHVKIDNFKRNYVSYKRKYPKKSINVFDVLFQIAALNLTFTCVLLKRRSMIHKLAKTATKIRVIRYIIFNNVSISEFDIIPIALRTFLTIYDLPVSSSIYNLQFFVFKIFIINASSLLLSATSCHSFNTTNGYHGNYY